MKNTLITKDILLKMASKKDCNAVFGLGYIFIPGLNKNVANCYVLYIFNFNTSFVTHLSLQHKPRPEDVLVLFDKLGNNSSSMLVALFTNPFSLKQTQEFANIYFNNFLMFKNRPRLGYMYLFQLFLAAPLNHTMEGFKSDFNSKLLDSGFHIYLTSCSVDKFVEVWNCNADECCDLVLNAKPELKAEFYPQKNEDEYKFNEEFDPGTAFESKISLYPLTHCSVNNKLFKSIYNVLTTNKDILELANPKIILINVYAEKDWFAIGKSFVLLEDMDFPSFLSKFEEAIFNLRNRAYPMDNVDCVMVRIFKPRSKIVSSLTTPSGVRKYSTYRPKFIPQLIPKSKASEKVGVLDIETVLIGSRHVPYAIGYKLANAPSIMFYISDYGDNLSVNKKMMGAFIDSFLANAKGHYIYVHNLGAFDGYLLLKEFNRRASGINILMDKQRKFITIDIKDSKTNLRDSLRILPASLASLSEMFDVPIKKGNFDHGMVNKTSIFNHEFKNKALEYLERDLISLFDIIKTATNYILTNYGVDLSKCYSASSMAIKIYRTQFMKDPIPTLPSHIDREVRKAYRGGATEVYNCVGYNLYYYDVNSLYSYAMLNPMPFNFVKLVKDVDLSQFFGFVEANIYAPSDLFNPFLPFKDNISGKIIYPHGHFSGLFFSEELKLAISKGYIVDIKLGYEFTKKNIFSDYVDHFYSKKQNSSGGNRFLYKLMLNSIYGYLGRNLDIHKTEIVSTQAARRIMEEYNILEYIELGDNTVFIMRDTIPSPELQKMNNLNQSHPAENFGGFNNVAISASITSYARMAMVSVKTDINNPPFYTDTDSVFLPKPLNPALVGPGLGLFKDELNGKTIREALFLAPKMYGYKTDDFEKVVISGVKPGDVSYEELKIIWRGGSITKNRSIISKNLKTMSINSKNIDVVLTLDKENMSKTPIYGADGNILRYSPPILK